MVEHESPPNPDIAAPLASDPNLPSPSEASAGVPTTSEEQPLGLPPAAWIASEDIDVPPTRRRTDAPFPSHHTDQYGRRKPVRIEFRTPEDAKLLVTQSVMSDSVTLESIIIRDVDRMLLGLTNVELLNALKDAVLSRWEYKLKKARYDQLALPQHILDPITSADDYFGNTSGSQTGRT